MPLPQTLRYNFSTPQKHPPAKIARWELGGNCAADSASGCRDIDAEVVNGRRKRERKAGIWKAMIVSEMIETVAVVVVCKRRLAMLLDVYGCVQSMFKTAQVVFI